MKAPVRQYYYFTVVIFFLCITASAEKVLIYDPVKGIVLVEKNSSEFKNNPAIKKIKRTPPAAPYDKNNIHIGRQKDPPELYFKSGLEYYKNNDFKNALKNFMYSDSVDPKAEYMLWVGRAYRQQKNYNQMLFTFQQLIENYPTSDVADDALFEIALHYQNINDYELSSQLYTRLIEQYPFGLSYGTGEELREIAREQKKLMRAEMTTLLSILGFSSDDLSVSYKNFQRVYNLEQTGIADIKTVNTIKLTHKKFLENEELNALKEKNSRKFFLWSMITGSCILVNILFLLCLKSKINSRKKHLSELSKILKDLQLSKL
ncbi:MAG: tetratricopeptide repeat protein [Fibrobacter sp.]|nr:tetratricopeptide repeat protein [Fibrobacter sp.]